MEAKSRFKVKLSNEAQEFLDGLPNKVREKIISLSLIHISSAGKTGATPGS